MRTSILNVGFDSVTMAEAVDRAAELMAGGKTSYIVTPNPEIVMACWDNPELMSAVQGADLVIPDGIGVVKANGGLRLRSGPGTGYEVIDCLPKGASVTVNDRSHSRVT